MPDMTFSDMIQGGGAMIALYLAIQIRGMALANQALLRSHEDRITLLEDNSATASRPKRTRRRRR